MYVLRPLLILTDDTIAAVSHRQGRAAGVDPARPLIRFTTATFIGQQIGIPKTNTDSRRLYISILLLLPITFIDLTIGLPHPLNLLEYSFKRMYIRKFGAISGRYTWIYMAVSAFFVDLSMKIKKINHKFH